MSYHHLVGDSRGTAGDKPEEGGDDVKSHGLYVQGYTLQWPVQTAAKSQDGANRKTGLSSDCSLQLDCIKLDPSNRGSACRGEYVPGLVHTARHITK